MTTPAPPGTSRSFGDVRNGGSRRNRGAAAAARRCWHYHDTDSERLARELEAIAEAGLASDIVAPFLHLSTHTIGHHLGDWARALRLGKRAIDDHPPSFETAKAWGRLHVAAVLAGEYVEAQVLELSYLKAAGDDLVRRCPVGYPFDAGRSFGRLEARPRWISHRRPNAHGNFCRARRA